ncbi:MAG: hypothetical protein R2864_07415 [Syntrophotaleaceae bacterium]
MGELSRQRLPLSQRPLPGAARGPDSGDGHRQRSPGRTPGNPLSRLARGSWINGDFDVWIGHHESTAWQWLHQARQENIVPPLKTAGTDQLPEPLLHLLRAEGSDWFWWYGDHHQTAQAKTFDRLFRNQLQALYRSAGRPVPEHLYSPIKEPLR